ncbi:acyltransferase domain-containing protein [Microbispora bryophytorum]|uniref:acyltransferase domain-containing protein n=1 Tax=Microbispora bryophytorum TaxID=1460882 RepID=UPI0033C24E69
MIRVAEITIGAFPGQGAYSPGCLESMLTDNHVRQVVDEIDGIATRMLGRGLKDTVLLTSPPTADELLSDAPDVLQVAAFATSVALHRLLCRHGAEITLLVGHSLGEISALVAGEALTVAEGTEVLCHRILALREHDTSGGRMLALSCGRDRAEQILALLRDGDAVVAVDNGPKQTTVSGTPDALTRIEAIAAAIGVQGTPLLAPHPFHNPLLQEARADFARRIAGVRARDLRTPVYSPILRRYYRAGEELGPLLASHFVTPVHFGDSVRRLSDAGARIWVELGAGRTLTNLARSIDPSTLALVPLAGRTSSVSEVAAFLRPAAAPAPPAVQTAAPLGVGAPVAGPAHVPVPDVVPVPAPSPAATAATAATAAAAPDREEIATRIRQLYARILEYPEEVFEDTAELEADLGVDSVKQTEMFAQVAEAFGLGMRPDGFRVADYPTFGAVVDFVHRSAPPMPSPAPAPAPAPVSAPPVTPAQVTPAQAPVDAPATAAAVPDREEIATRIRQLYARILEYPEEVFEDTAELEADLGVDSVKQTEMFAQVAEAFGLGMRPDGFRVADYPTFGAVVGFVCAALDGAEVAVR